MPLLSGGLSVVFNLTQGSLWAFFLIRWGKTLRLGENCQKEFFYAHSLLGQSKKNNLELTGLNTAVKFFLLSVTLVFCIYLWMSEKRPIKGKR